MKTFLTIKNRAKLYVFLDDYLKEVLEEEEYINTFQKAYEEAERVQLYGNRRFLTSAMIKDWLQGLPIGISYITYTTCLMLIEEITGKNDINVLDEYKEDMSDLDNFYWETLGKIIYNHVHFDSEHE